MKSARRKIAMKLLELAEKLVKDDNSSTIYEMVALLYILHNLKPIPCEYQGLEGFFRFFEKKLKDDLVIVWGVKVSSECPPEKDSQLGVK